MTNLNLVNNFLSRYDTRHLVMFSGKRGVGKTTLFNGRQKLFLWLKQLPQKLFRNIDLALIKALIKELASRVSRENSQ